ncbi:MAG: xanthine dehydrogenase family protein subunit M [Anaerolineales bacterium]|nr:xanthine dehydrogenase family protein subunit M [Anaerolineales bacterium]MCX7609221.1 xanthine dehydrogenase family protein subunit M [Anaerolineales bacterium]
MRLWQEYYRPATLTEALQALAYAPGLVLPIAGGTDLMLDLEQGRHPPVHALVDLTFLPELKRLEVQGDELLIGAAVPLSQIATSPLVAEHAQALTEACALIGGPQVRNVATLGGNVAHALPAADGTIALTALGAQVTVADLECARRVPLESLFLGPGKSALRPGQLITTFHLPLRRRGQASAFRRVMRLQGIALPILNLAIWLAREGERIADLRLAVGPSGPTPRRMTATEAIVRGQTMDDSLIEQALHTLLEEAHFRTSPHRASAEYRRQVVGALLREGMQAAWDRACEPQRH